MASILAIRCQLTVVEYVIGIYASKEVIIAEKQN